jgi:PhnB protein
MKNLASRSPAPNGWHTVTPRIVARDAEQLVAFLHKVFDATGTYQKEQPAEVRIGDSLIMVSDVGVRDPMGAFLYVYVNDVDPVYDRAVKAGAKSLEEPAIMPYGDRRAMVQDRWGNVWQIAAHVKNRG